MTSRSKPAGPAPGRAALQEAALRHMARFAVTEVGLIRVLDRAVMRWARRAAAEGQDTTEPVKAGRDAARETAASLVKTGLVNDEVFAEARAARLLRGGRSRVLVSQHLAAKGVARDVAGAALLNGPDDLVVALAYARRRRLGPFQASPAATTHERDLAILARAGFSRSVAEQVLAMDRETAIDTLTPASREP